MGLVQRNWARKSRAKLIEVLGGVCKKCGSDEELEIDCIIPQGDWHHKIEWSWRTSFYWQQARNGNAQLLCHDCNVEKGNHVPF